MWWVYAIVPLLLLSAVLVYYYYAGRYLPKSCVPGSKYLTCDYPPPGPQRTMNTYHGFPVTPASDGLWQSYYHQYLRSKELTIEDAYNAWASVHA